MAFQHHLVVDYGHLKKNNWVSGVAVNPFFKFSHSFLTYLCQFGF